MKIKVLIENTTDSDLRCEHGLSLFIEYDDKKILLDAGSTDAFADNACHMGVDLATVDMAFLSHGHYDHSGGFGAFAQRNEKAPVYAMESAMKRYASASCGSLHEIGVPESVKEVLKDRLVSIDKVTKVAEGITLVPHSTPEEVLKKTGAKAGLYCEDSGRWQPDDFSHEMSLVLETEKGLVILNSCSHGGVQNIIAEVKNALPGQKICAYVGGLHMKGRKDGEEICTFSEEEVKALAETVCKENIEGLLTGHCTGEPAIALLEKYMEHGRIVRLCTGAVYDFGK